MRTAKEYVQKHQAVRDTPQLNLCDIVVADILARDIEVLEEAAKLACPMCLARRRFAVGTCLHLFGGGGTTLCRAYAIYDRVDELKREAAGGD